MCQKNLGCPLERASARGRGWGVGGRLRVSPREKMLGRAQRTGWPPHVTLWRELTAVDCSGKVLLAEVFCTLQSMK